MDVTRIAWLTTVGVALITALLLLLAGYTGYAGLGLAVAAGCPGRPRARAGSGFPGADSGSEAAPSRG